MIFSILKSCKTSLWAFQRTNSPQYAEQYHFVKEHIHRDFYIEMICRTFVDYLKFNRCKSQAFNLMKKHIHEQKRKGVSGDEWWD